MDVRLDGRRAVITAGAAFDAHASSTGFIDALVNKSIAHQCHVFKANAEQ